jgi:hypothetical protein
MYADRASNDEQLLLRPFLWETKNMIVEGWQWCEILRLS